jgi:hypothetical protein
VFVRTGEAIGQFRKAVERVDAEAALAAAGEIRNLSLRDSLELVRVLARAADPRLDSAARRWLELVSRHEGIALADVQLASAAMGILAVDPDSERAWETLTMLVRA